MRALKAQLFTRLQGSFGGGGAGPVKLVKTTPAHRHLSSLSSFSGDGVVGGSNNGSLSSLSSVAYQCRGYARFKLRLEEKPKPEQNEETKTPQEGMATEEDDGGYWKSHPYRQLDTGWKSKSELAKLLVDNVIHNDHGLFITNKPFGVGVRTPPLKCIQNQQKLGNLERLHLRGLPTCPFTLEDCLPELRYLLNKPNLVICRSTEKYTSGPAVFCDDEPTSKHFSKCVASSKLYFDTLYKYHCVTTLPPVLLGDPEKIERLGVTIKQGVGTDIGQPVIQHNYSKNSVKRGDVISVHCQSKILQKSNATLASLLEINTSSIAHNFLRIYCTDKLAPILGDHLYSARVQLLQGLPIKVDPTHLVAGSQVQKLSGRIQGCLKLLKPEDAIIVPVHVHLRSYQVRKFFPGDKNAVMYIEAPYPKYFRWTCEQLGMVLDADSTVISSS